MNGKFAKLLYFIVCYVFFLFADLFFSRMLYHSVSDGFSFSNRVFEITFVKNTGAAFNLFPDAREFLIILAVVVLTLLFLYVIKNLKSIWFKELFFISMLCAGVAGNLHERISLGYVRDFFNLNFISFPVFNISDILINIAVVALVIIILLKKTK
ncbi:signal peptidase II [bacterium]|nr:signal peptidase II [bacterium]